ncbi:MAG: AMP-binding protein, partial [Steroidobacteraceae bacterium]
MSALLHVLIEAQARRTPHRPAVRARGVELSYHELNARANRYAHYMRELGVGPDAVVGVLMERCLEMEVAVLAILKAGGAYLPIDTDYPDQRLERMLGDASLALLLT